MGKIKATVFVEESYGLAGGKTVITNSRLLSKNEVDAIGINNFKSLDRTSTLSAARNKKYKLTITFSGTYSKSGNSIDCDLTGNASWTNNGPADGKRSPAVGTDYLGFAWSGDFEGENGSASATLSNGNAQDIFLEGASPNSGRVWAFDEYWNAGGKYTLFVNNVDTSMTLHKDNMTGGGNKAEAVMKYIHTYQSLTGSISISASPDSIGSGFTLNNTSKQWGLSCIINGIPY